MIGAAPRAGSCSSTSTGTSRSASATRSDLGRAGARATARCVFADVGWDPTGAWSADRAGPAVALCHAFLPNAVEAMAYTRTDTPHDALYALADRVPLAVVTNGAHGALAIDSTTGEEASVPALRVAGASTRPGPATSSAPACSSARWPAGRCSTGSRSRRCARPGGAAVRRLARRPGLGRHRRLVAPRCASSRRPTRPHRSAAAPVRLPRRHRADGARSAPCAAPPPRSPSCPTSGVRRPRPDGRA